MKRLVALAMFAALAAAVLIVLKDRTRQLTPERLAEAQRLWSARGPSDYELELLVEGDRIPPERYRVQVRAAKVALFEMNGQAGENGGAYTIPGIFDLMERELVLSRGPVVPGAPERAQLKAEFDGELGYPTVFKRLASYGLSRFLKVERFTRS